MNHGKSSRKTAMALNWMERQLNIGRGGFAGKPVARCERKKKMEICDYPGLTGLNADTAYGANTAR